MRYSLTELVPGIVMVIYFIILIKQLLGKLLANVESRESIALNASLQPMVDDAQSFLTSYLQGAADNLIRCARAHCSSILNVSSAVDHLKKAVERKLIFPANIVQVAILEDASSQLVNKSNELATAMATQISDIVIEEVVQSLSDINKSLVGLIYLFFLVGNFFSY